MKQNLNLNIIINKEILGIYIAGKTLRKSLDIFIA